MCRCAGQVDRRWIYQSITSKGTYIGASKDKCQCDLLRGTLLSDLCFLSLPSPLTFYDSNRRNLLVKPIIHADMGVLMLLWPTLTNGSLMVTDPRLTLMTVQSGTVSESSSAWMIFRGSNLIIKSNKCQIRFIPGQGFGDNAYSPGSIKMVFPTGLSIWSCN